MVKVGKQIENNDSIEDESPGHLKFPNKSTMPPSDEFLVIKGFPNQSPKRGDEHAKHISFAAKFKAPAVSTIKKPFAGTFVINGDMPVYKPVFDRDSVSPKKGEDYIGETEAASQHLMFRHNKMLPAESFLKQNLRRNGGRSEERRAHSVTPSIILKDENSVLGPKPIIFDDHSKHLDNKTSYLLRLSKRGNSKGGQLASLQVTGLQRQKEERAKKLSQMTGRFSKLSSEDEPHGIGFVPSTPWTHLAGEYIKSCKPIT